jgi:hypothetical protein
MSLRRASDSNRALQVGCFPFFSDEISVSCPTLAHSDSLYSYDYLKTFLFLDSQEKKNQRKRVALKASVRFRAESPNVKQPASPWAGFQRAAALWPPEAFPRTPSSCPLDSPLTTKRRAMRAKETPCS